MSLVALEKVTKRYGDKTALFPLDIQIGEGEFLTVFGANGAGKSTLLKIISKQMRPTDGIISYRDKDIRTLGEAYRSKLGVISHQPFLYEGLSAYDNLMFYARLYGIKTPGQRAKEVLTRVELKNRMHDPVRTYSRGMLQRASIARALINAPEIVFLDEPYTGLDRHASYVLTDILKEQTDRRSTVILVTHDLALGYELATKLLILNKGRVVHYGGHDIAEADFERFYLEKVEN